MPAPAAQPGRYVSYLRGNGYNLGLIAIVAWVANYLHLTKFGVYEDDWFYVGFPFFIGAKTWLTSSLLDILVRAKAQGRPIQVIGGYLASALGAATDSLVVDYLIAYVLFTASALLVYEVVRYRFNERVATLSSLLFVLTPLHTLHQFLNGQFTLGPAFILVFSGMLLYLRGHHVWGYIVAALSILGYESIFFLFLGVPLLQRGDLLRGRRREWITHLTIVGALALCYFAARSLLAETRVSSLSTNSHLLRSVVYSWFFYTFASFATYLHAAYRATEATAGAYIAAVLLIPLCIIRLVRYRRTSAESKDVPVLQSAAIAFVFLGLGCVVSYFFFQSAPVLVVTDRDTRIFCAASFGSSLLFAVLLDESFRIARSDLARWFVSAAAAVFLGILFLYSFVLQNDYVADWAGQRRLIRDMVALTPDLKRDSAILLRLTLAYDSSPVWGRRRGIGNERFIYEQEFGWLCARGGRWPSLFIVYSDAWLQHLKLDADGLLAWTEPTFDGRWLPVTGRFRPGRLIVIDGRQPEHVFRRSEPVQVGGVQIVQPAPDSNPSGATLWSLVPSNDLSQSFFAASSWKAGAVAKRETGDRNPRLSSPAPGTLLLQSPLTLTWTPVPDAVNYWIDVGTGSGLNDIWGGFSNGETSVDVDISRYLTGAAIHVQIYAAFADYHLVPGSGSKYSFATSRGLSPAISGHGGGKATQ